MATLVPAPNAQPRRATSIPVIESERVRFPLFFSLPLELRLMIWALNDPGSRLVHVHYVPETGEFYTTTISPANLRICRESRRETSRHWGLHFGTCGHSPLIRANLDIDTIQIDWFPIRLGLVDKLDVSHIRYIELSGKDLQKEQDTNTRIRSLPNATHRVVHRLLAFPNLEVITIVLPPRTRLEIPPGGGPPPWQHLAQYMELKWRRDKSYLHAPYLESALKRVEGTRLVQGRKIPILNTVKIDKNGARDGPYLFR